MNHFDDEMMTKIKMNHSDNVNDTKITKTFEFIEIFRLMTLKSLLLIICKQQHKQLFCFR